MHVNSIHSINPMQAGKKKRKNVFFKEIKKDVL